MTPARGTARGGTSFVLNGSSLNSGSGSSSYTVKLNGYEASSCKPATGQSTTAVQCVSGSRWGAIHPQDTTLVVSGKGAAMIVPKETRWLYIDRWSDPRTWLDSEMPVDGDTVIVPEGEAILVDLNTPKLFLVLVLGTMVFADDQDLNFNATYIWVAGGTFQIGTEERPFTHKATITLFGDRWNTIELPFIGSKVLAVTNRGGLKTECHSNSLGTTAPAEMCEVRSVGKLDLHGRRSISWTRLNATVENGATSVRLAEKVDWPVQPPSLIPTLCIHFTPRWDRVVSLPPYHLYGAAIQRAHHSGQAEP